MPHPASLYPLEARDRFVSAVPCPPSHTPRPHGQARKGEGQPPHPMLTPEWVPVPLGLMLRGDGHHQAITQIPCAVKRMTGSKGPGSEGLPKVICQPSQVMGQPVQRLRGRNKHVIKQQKGSEWTSAEYGCALGEMRSQSCDHGEDGTDSG